MSIDEATTMITVSFSAEPRVLQVQFPNNDVWEAEYDATGKRTWNLVIPKSSDDNEEEGDDSDEDSHRLPVQLDTLAKRADTPVQGFDK